jgi:isopentenyl-diphosphate delta-isomerase
MQTAQCVEQCMEKVKVPVIASGGIRNGIEATKALAMGASLVGLALPLLKPATKSADAVKAVLNHIITEIKISMFLVGAPNLGELKGKVVKI